MRSREIHLLEAGIVTEQRSVGIAEAPAALVPALASRLSADKRVRVPFNPRDRWLTAARESCRVLGDAVAASLSGGSLPVVVGGECTLVAGTVHGMLQALPDARLIYLCARADFHTLATTRTHQVSRMCLAHICGRSVAPLLWPGAKRMADDRVILVGARVMDAGEAGNLARTKVLHLPFDANHTDPKAAVAAVRRKDAWLHLSVDLLDPTECPAALDPAPDGPTLAQLRALLAALAGAATIRGVTIAGYDTRKDAEGPKLPGVLAEVLAEVLGRASGVPA
ncbi:MAG: hypothetical protein FJ034_05950 [Chloroflexi bacterium]|nr:hypothetical protein [Chloroflexota bacterium]